MKKEYPIDILSYQFPVKVPVQIRFSDVDGFGHVNNNAMQTYFDLGRAEYMSYVVGNDFYEHSDTLIIANYTTDFLRQVHFDDKIEVRTAVYHVGNKSVKIITALVDTASQDVCAVSDAVMVGCNMQSQKSVVLPDLWRQKIEQREGRKF